MFVSTYDINGFFNALLEVRKISFWVRSSMIPVTANFKLTTSSLNVLLPGIAGHYGADLPVDIHINIISLGKFQIFEAN